MRTSLPHALGAVLLLLAVSAGAVAQESALAMLPAKAPLVVQVNGVEKARQRLGKLLGNAVPDRAPKLMKQLNDWLSDDALEGRPDALKAVAKEGHVFVVVTDLSSLAEEPNVAVVFPVTGYKEFLETFLKEDERKSLQKQEGGYDTVKVEGQEQPMCLIDRKTHVVAARTAEVAKLFLDKQGGLDKALSPYTRQAFLGADAALYVNLAAVNEAYGASIKGFKSLMELLMQQGGAAGGLDKKQTELVKDMFSGIFQVIEDGVAAVVALDFRPEGLNLRLQAEFGDNTKTRKFLQGLQPGPLVQLGTLPTGQMSYSAMRLDPKLSKALTAVISQLLVTDENEEAAKAIQSAARKLDEAGLEGQFAAASFPKNDLEVSVYKDPVKAVSANLELLKAISATSQFQSIPVQEKPTIREDAETVAGFRLHHAHIKLDLDKAVANLPEAMQPAMRAQLQRQVGSELKIWFGTDGKVFVKAIAKDWKAAKTLLEEYSSGRKALAKDAAFQLARKNLPADATMMMLLDTGPAVSEMVEMARQSFQAVPGAAGALPQIPELRKPTGGPSYTGFAIALKPEGGSLDIFVPVTAIHQLRKMFAPLLEGDD